MKELKVRQEKFCQAYVLYRNATESAKIAGYSEGSAHTQGHRLLQREDIKQRIEELEKEVETRIDVVSEIENQYTYAKLTREKVQPKHDPAAEYRKSREGHVLK
jgi:phage terminase small subunit